MSESAKAESPRSVFRDALMEALESAFRDWRVENAHALALGGLGDVTALFLALSEAAMNCRNSASEAPMASLNTFAKATNS